MGIIEDEPIERDHRCSDVFALGCMLWELLAGRRLFRGPTEYESLVLARQGHVPALEDVPTELGEIVCKALATNVESRYQTPGELGAALAEHLVVRTRN